MAYQGKTVIAVAEECHCSEEEFKKFLRRSGIYFDGSFSYLTENAYNLARNHFLGIPIPKTQLQTEHEQIKAELAKIKTQLADAQSTKNELFKIRAELKTEIAQVKTELADTQSLKTELKQIKTQLADIQALKTELAKIKTELADTQAIKTELKQIKTRLADVQVIETELAKIKTEFANTQTTKSESAHKKSSTQSDYQQLLAKYDVEEINSSVMKYFEAVLNLTDELLNDLHEYEASQADTIAEFLKIALKLKDKYTDNPKLNSEENSILANRQSFLAERLELSTDKPVRKILMFKEQAEVFFNKLDEINCGYDSIKEIAKLEAEPRASFELLVENLSRIVNAAKNKVNFFTEHKKFVSNVVELQAAWSDDYKAFKTRMREELFAVCQAESIDEEIYLDWYDDWQKKRFAIEKKVLPLIEYGLKGHLADAIEDVLKILQSYKSAVDKFYLNERKNIYQRFAFMPSGDLQEKFETESEIYKLTDKLHRELQEIIFSLGKTEEQVFLLKWSEPLLNSPIDEINDFIIERGIKKISEEVLTQFTELKRQNFATYLSDGQAYSDAIKKRAKDYNALIFRMRKDLR